MVNNGASRVGNIIFNNQNNGLPKRPRPRHEQLQSVTKRFLELSGIGQTIIPDKKVREINISVLDALFEIKKSATKELPTKTEVDKKVFEGELWQGIITRQLPRLEDFIKDGVRHKDVPVSVSIKDFGRLVIAIRTESRDNEFRCFSLFQDDKKKVWWSETIDRTIKSVSSIIHKVFEGRELTEENKILFKSAIQNEKIVLAPSK